MKKLLSILFVITVLMTSLLSVSVGAAEASATTASKWDGTVPAADKNYAFGGEGTEESPYLIDSAAELAQLASNVRYDDLDTCYAGKYFKLTTDIDLDNKPWYSIGGMIADLTKSASSYTYFGGHFDGDYHTISNLSVSDTDASGNAVNFIGLFGSVSGAEICNLGIESGCTTVDSGTLVAGNLIGVMRYGGRIENCYNKADMVIKQVSGTQKINVMGAFAGQIMDKNSAMRDYDTTNANGPTKPANNTETSGYTEVEIWDCYNTGDLTATYDIAHTTLEYRLGLVAGTIAGASPELIGVYNTGDITVNDSSTSTKANRRVSTVCGAAMDSSYLEDVHTSGDVIVTYTNTTVSNLRGMLVGGGASGQLFENCSYVASTADPTLTAKGENADATTVTIVESVTIPLASGSTFLVAAENVGGDDAGDNGDGGNASAGGNNNTDNNNDNTTDKTEDTSDTTADTEAKTTTKATETEASDGGCGGSVAVSALAVVALVSGGAVALTRKKKND